MYYDAFIKKLQTETVFFINTYEDAAIRSIPGNDYFVKCKGKEEFRAKDGSSIVTDAILEYKKITEEEYNSF